MIKIIVIIIVALLTNITLRQIFQKTEFLPDSIDSLEYRHTVSLNEEGTIYIKERYRKKDGSYIAFETSLTGKRKFCWTEEKFDKIFGKDSDRFDTEVYTISISEKILKCRSCDIPPKDIVRILEQKDRIIDDLELYPQIWAEISQSMGTYIIGDMTATKLSIMGESDFSKTEISKLKQDFWDMAKLCKAEAKYIK